MIDAIGSFLVHEPLSILALAVIALIVWMLARFSGVVSLPHPNWLLAPAAGFGLYAFWEWLVMTRSPEANIRVDLPVIWVVLLIVTAWSVFRAAR